MELKWNLKVKSKNKPVVLHVVISLKTGGLERFVIDLIKANINDFDQCVVCLEMAGELSKLCQADIISLNMLPGLHLGIAWDLAKIIKKKKVDVIHTHNEKAQLYGGLAGLLTNVPVVHTKHGKNDLDWRAIVRNNITARLCCKLVAVSRDAAQECINDEKIPSVKVLTILNGVDTDQYFQSKDRVESKRLLGFGEGTLVVGIVARLAQVKDHATLFKACRILFESDLNFKLMVVGDGPLRGNLEELADTLGICSRVIFTGMREDIAELMQAMDVFVLSSISEGISLTLLEAMACCLPVVATHVGGNPEVVEDGVTGFLVPAQQPELLADKLRILITESELRLKMGVAGRQRIVNFFSLSTTAAKYSDMYFTLLG